MHESLITPLDTLFVKSKINLSLDQFQKIFYPTYDNFSISSAYLYPKNAYVISKNRDFNVEETLEIKLGFLEEQMDSMIRLTKISSNLVSGTFSHRPELDYPKITVHCSKKYNEVIKDMGEEEDFALQLEFSNENRQTNLLIMYHVVQLNI